MGADLSIVIPVLDAEKSLPACLSALIEGLLEGLVKDLILADGGSQDATLAIADEAGARVLSTPPSRGGQIRAGIEAARGDWVLVLHADTILPPGWAEVVREHIDTDPGRAGYFRLGFDTGGLRPALVAGWANSRARLIGLPFGDQGLLISRALCEELGGYPDIPLMEDVAIARALSRARLKELPLTARTSAARYVKEGWFRRGARNLSLQLRYLFGAAPERLAQRYRQ